MSRKNIAFDTGFLDKPLLHHHDTSVDDVVPPAETVQTSAEVLKSPFVLGGVLVVLSVFAIGLWQIMSPDVGVPAVAVHAPEVDVDFVSEVLVEKPVEVKASVPLVAEPVQETAMQDSAIEKNWVFPEHKKPAPAKQLSEFQAAPPVQAQQVVYYMQPVVYNSSPPQAYQVPQFPVPARQPKQP